VSQYRKVRSCAFALGLAASLTFAAGASANVIKMPTMLKAIQEREANAAAGTPLDPGITPPAPPCPENGQLGAVSVSVPGVGTLGASNCGLPEFPGIGTPTMGNMSYWGGPVQTHPKVYLVYWGWNQDGAFPNDDCLPGDAVTLTEGSVVANNSICDPDGAGQLMADFVKQMGGTQWAGVSTQYFQKDGTQISNDKDVLGGIWVDDSVPADFEKTTGDGPGGDKNTYTLLAREADKAAAHFGVSGKDLVNADFVIAQPPGLSDPNALSEGYCAFHDYTQPKIENGWYDGVTPGIVYTNMPYSLAINSSGFNVCGEHAVNSDERGKDDGFTIALGHEIEEAITDPGAEEILGGNGITDSQTILGGWYDPFDANENGDKCAWVGVDPTDEEGTEPVPGAEGDIKGNGGDRFAVQSLWSNNSAGGAGYCAGAGTDLPGPLAGGEGGGIARSASRG